MGPARIVLATNNAHKIEEIKAILPAMQAQFSGLEGLTSQPEPEETASDYLGNALIKARYYADLTGLPALADDSGLEVDALDGRPGVLSARYGGAHTSSAEKIQLLLAELKDRPDRTAHFHCVVVLAQPQSELYQWAEGVCRGHLLTQASTGGQGFGYDPIFVPDGYTETFSELPSEIKHQLSHRGQALRALFSSSTED